METSIKTTSNKKALISFSIGLVMLGFFMGWTVAAVLNNAWGYDFNNSKAYNEVMNATRGAAANVTDSSASSTSDSNHVFVFDISQLAELQAYNNAVPSTDDNINLFDALKTLYIGGH